MVCQLFLPSFAAECDDLPVANDNTDIIYTPPREVLPALHGDKWYKGIIATYSCSPGYQLVNGSSLRACGPKYNAWNGTEPSCSKKWLWIKL